MADPAPAEQPGENFYEPISPEGREPKPSATVQVHDSQQILREMPPQDAREIFGEEITAEWSPEDAVKELHKKRGQQGQQPNNTVAFARDGRRPAQSDKEAAADLSFSRRVEHANRLMEALPGIGPERAVGTASEALTGGHVHQYVLDDKDRASPLSHGDDPKTAQQRLTALREQRASDLHALAEQLSQPAEQQSAQTEQPLQPEQQPPLQQPEQPQQPDPIQQARAAAEAAIQSAQEYQRLSADEAHVHAWFAQTVQGFYQKYGNPTPEQIVELEKTNPALVKQLVQDYQQLQTGNAQLNELRARREFRERQIAEGRAAEMNKAAAKWLSEQDALAAKALPELNDPQRGPELQRAAVEVLRDAGLSDEEVNALWHGKQSVNLRDVRSQKILADAAKWRLAQAKAHAARPEPLPQVHRPGTAMSKSEIGAADQSARLGRLGYLSPTDAMREGARLLSERRGRR